MTMESLGEALIIGAGVGGLTAANALYRTGWRVTVLERADALRPIGAGISQPPNAQHALDAIDLGDATLGDRVRAAGEPAGAIGARRPDGRWIYRPGGDPVGKRYGYPFYTLLRTDLLNVLAGELPEGTVRFEAEVRTVQPGDAGTRARVETVDGAVYEADLVVAADGGRSTVRSLLFPEHPGPEYGGYAVWWMLSPGIGDHLIASETLGKGAIWGSFGLRDGRVYAYATMVTEPGGSSEDPIAPLRERFGDWHEEVRKVLAAVDPASVFRDDARWMRVPLPALHRGRVAVLGDAAHPMTPDLGQGGSQSIEDAVVLARLVAGGDGRGNGGVVSALAAYTEARLARTSDIVKRSKKMAAFHHPRTALGRYVRDQSLKLTASERLVGLFLRQYDPVFGWKP
jgi:2-polyprenyl-6-methoxyphenol hydroxylase-like FAD-dependent oxidoreductase